MTDEWWRENVFDVLLMGTFIAVPTLAALLWWCWGRNAREPDLALEQIWAGSALLSLVLVLVLVTMNALNLFLWNFWRNFSPG